MSGLTGAAAVGGAATGAVFPLSAIVGQEALVEALLVNAVAPDVGGVLVRGERGTAKSTAVRGLAPLLPPVLAADGQPFAFAPGERAPGGLVPAEAPVRERSAPLVELPLGATLDRLVGALDLGRALAGEAAFEPGLLARAHRGILYVDEVNLLPDHLVDALLDAAASGVARVEREAVSVEHAARFVLVGTMNAEEGELRPQLLDRFGLGVEVRTPAEPAQRAEIVRRRLAFEHDPAAFAARWADVERVLAERIARARALLPAVQLPERELQRIVGACAALGVDGVRGDIVTARAARALAALDGADVVEEAHVRRAARLALAHRRRRDPLDGHAPDADELERALDGEDDPDGPDGEPPGGASRPGSDAAANGSRPSRAGAERGASTRPAPDASAARASDTDDASASQAVADPADSPAAERRDPADASASRSAGPADAPDRNGPPDAPDRNGPPDAPAARERRDAPAPARLPLDALWLAGRGAGPAGRRARGSGPGAGAIDSRPASPDAGDLALVATLRARLAGAPDGQLRAHVRAGREGVLLCLVVDASGSMGARRRLARVKGALLALLRDAYARRDRVAVIAFRDRDARLLVAPGAPIERAAAAIRALPTGGRTPLAAGLQLATETIARERRREPQRRALALVLTDGRVEDPERAVPRAAARLARAAAAVHVVDIEDGPVRLGLAGTLAAAAGALLHRLDPVPVATRRAA